MNGQDLKNSILQLAMQGKLVEQRPEEGTGEELYQQIQEEKQKLIASGKIKKEKSLSEIQEGEIPFEIPKSWKWVRTGDVGSWASGSTPSRSNPKYYNGNIYWLKTGDLNDAYINETSEFITELALNNTSVRLNPKGSVLMAMYGATIGKLGILNIDSTTNQACCACITYEKINNKFLFYYLMAMRIYFIRKGEGGAQPNISKEKILNSVFPLPPFEEQRRIVDKIDKVLSLVEEYGKLEGEREDLDVELPEKLKKSILQYAMQGKLVPQIPSEGSAEELYAQIQEEKQKLIKSGKLKKEKPLPPITEDEIPFQIPPTWKWVRLGECGTFLRGSGIKRSDICDDGKPCVRYGQLYTKFNTRFRNAISFINEDLFLICKKANKNDILMSLTGENDVDIALAVLYEGDEEIAIGGDMTRFTPIMLNSLFLTFLINSPYMINRKSELATGRIIVHISNDKLASIPIPLPPLKEQNRIVNQINYALKELG